MPYAVAMRSFDPKTVLAGRSQPGALVAMIISGVCALVIIILFVAHAGGVAIVSMLLAGISLTGMLAIVFLVLNKLNPAPRYLMITVLLGGGGIAVAVSMLLEIAIGGSGMVSGSVVAPIVEEMSKGLIVAFVFWFRRAHITSVTDGIIYAAMAGLGFAAVENVGYYISAAAAGSLGLTFFLRGILTAPWHALFTSMTGMALVAAARSRSSNKRIGLPFLGYAGAVALHATWNTLSSFGLFGIVFAWLFEAGMVAVVLVFANKDRQKIMARVPGCLSQYLSQGVADQTDLPMLATMRARNSALAWVARGGPQAKSAMVDFQDAATQLTLLHDRALTGTIDPQDFYFRQAWLVVMLQTAHQVIKQYPRPLTVVPAYGATHLVGPQPGMPYGAPATPYSTPASPYGGAAPTYPPPTGTPSTGLGSTPTATPATPTTPYQAPYSPASPYGGAAPTYPPPTGTPSTGLGSTPTATPVTPTSPYQAAYTPASPYAGAAPASPYVPQTPGTPYGGTAPAYPPPTGTPYQAPYTPASPYGGAAPAYPSPLGMAPASATSYTPPTPAAPYVGATSPYGTTPASLGTTPPAPATPDSAASQYANTTPETPQAPAAPPGVTNQALPNPLDVGAYAAPSGGTDSATTDTPIPASPPTAATPTAATSATTPDQASLDTGLDTASPGLWGPEPPTWWSAPASPTHPDEPETASVPFAS